MVVSVGIDVSKDKHDCFIVSSDGDVLADVFTISNTLDGFHDLLQRIQDCATPQDKIKVGLEATGHYSYNLLGFLLDNGLTTYVLNPLRTNLYRKSLSLRKTKTDRVDARTIASMLLSDAGLKPYTNTAYHNEKFYRPAGLHSVSGIGKTRPFSAYCFCLHPAGRVPRGQTGCRSPFNEAESTSRNRLQRPLQSGYDS